MTLESLRIQFTSPAWKAIHDDDSKLVKILLSDAFKEEDSGREDGEICTIYLICIGLLHCGAKPYSKAEEFYNLLQEGGLTHHKWISATDKDMFPVIEKLCLLTTTHLFDWAEQLAGIDNIYA